MSERSNVSIAEILGDNYYIDKLTSSDYSPSVGDTVTITLLVKDVFGDPVTGQTRTVTCTDGEFVSVNGSSITASSSVEVTTGSGGTVTLGLSVSVADNIIVSDGRAECVVSSLSTSIKVQYIESGLKSINNGANISVTHTVTACPTGYSWLWVQRESFRATQTDVSLNGTTLSYKLYNFSGGNSTACYVKGWLVFYPSSWNI